MTVTYTEPVMGYQSPRLALIPTCTSNAYEEAIELASAYGLTLDDWQAYVLKAWMGERFDGMWAAPRNGLSVSRQNGKGGALEARELYGLAILGERILHTAHEVKTALDHFRRMEAFFEDPDLKPMVKRISRTNGSEGIFLHNGGFIRFVARSKSSGRGFSADLLVCDEAQEMDFEKFAALLPTLAASPNPQTILTGTPPGPSVNGEVFAKWRDQGLEGMGERLSWLEWSCERDADLDDFDVWAQANPALGIRLSVEKIADERASLSDEEFARERLGMWAGIASVSVIDMDLWASLASSIDPTDPVAFAIDVSPDRDMASIGCAGYIGESTHVQVIENRKGTGWVVKRLKELKEKWNPVAIVVDQGSPAASLLPDLQAARIRVMTTNATDMANACGSFYDRVQNERLLHADQPALNAALQVAGKRPVRDAWAWNRKTAGADITPLVAVTLASHGLTAKRKPKAAVSRNTQQKVRLLN